MDEPRHSFEQASGYVEESMTSDNRWLLGVCSGIANRFGLEPVLVRVATLILGIIFPQFVAISYLLLWLFIFK